MYTNKTDDDCNNGCPPIAVRVENAGTGERQGRHNRTYPDHQCRPAATIFRHVLVSSSILLRSRRCRTTHITHKRNTITV